MVSILQLRVTPSTLVGTNITVPLINGIVPPPLMLFCPPLCTCRASRLLRWLVAAPQRLVTCGAGPTAARCCCAIGIAAHALTYYSLYALTHHMRTHSSHNHSSVTIYVCCIHHYSPLAKSFITRALITHDHYASTQHISLTKCVTHYQHIFLFCFGVH